MFWSGRRPHGRMPRDEGISAVRLIFALTAAPPKFVMTFSDVSQSSVRPFPGLPTRNPSQSFPTLRPSLLGLSFFFLSFKLISLHSADGETKRKRKRERERKLGGQPEKASDAPPRIRIREKTDPPEDICLVNFVNSSCHLPNPAVHTRMAEA